ncbi:unnamed protein product [Symbiodinium sp. CCMP2456]|nr:unnamed protein product [Symbiodinium sp. CCMP2456]
MAVLEPRRHRPKVALQLSFLAAAVAWFSWTSVEDAAFVTPETPSLDRRGLEGREISTVAMQGGNRKQNRRNKPKKMHPKTQEERYKKWAIHHPEYATRLFFVPEATLEDWSHTLKLTFPDGEDDVVSEEEVFEYFTTDEYKPEAVIVGHQMPHEEVKHAYVHFSDNTAAKKARKEKDGGAIGKASEVKLVYTDEKKWIRLRDGVSLAGGFWGPRSRWMKAYGTDKYKGWKVDETPLPPAFRAAAAHVFEVQAQRSLTSMGSSGSVCAELLEQMGWKDPPLAGDFHHPGLVNYLQNTYLEVVLPVHAPQNDYGCDQKTKQYPRPNFCWEAYKMHLAMIGPSSTCKKQFLDFMPRIAHIFKGTATKLAPGREAVPYHFLDSDLNRVVLWDLPEIMFKQKAEDYVRELGLLYIDCVFMLFSEKYVLTDIYCKLCVAMALHGIPFFVLCTQSEEGMDEKAVRRLQSSFQAQSVQVRMFNPAKPHETLEPLINDFFKEVTWNRSKGANSDRVKNASETVLGQTVRIKNLEKKAELNTRCGVCIGYEKDQDRYIVRLIMGGVETDVALRDQNFSVLKPKLRGSLVQLKGLQSKPELNGRYGFVDEFLRENERYRIFVPDKPGVALNMALKSENLEKVSGTPGAKPVTAAPVSSGSSPLPASGKPAYAPPARKPAQVPAASGAVNGATNGVGHGVTNGAANGATNGAANGSAKHNGAPTPQPRKEAMPAASKEPAPKEDEDLSAFLPKVGATEEEGGDDLMSRIFAAESTADVTQASARVEEKEREPAVTAAVPVKRLHLSKAGLLGMRVWAVIGDCPDAEDIIDHLMDCGKTVFNVGGGEGAHFSSTAELNMDPNLPKTEVLAFIDPKDSSAVLAALNDVVRLGVRGLALHPDESSFGSEVLAECRSAGIATYGVDVLEDVQPGTGLPVAPLD